MQTATKTETRADFPKRWYVCDEVAEITGQSADLVKRACRQGRVQGAYRKSPLGSSKWLIPGEGAQLWFDIMRGIKRDNIEGK